MRTDGNNYDEKGVAVIIQIQSNLPPRNLLSSILSNCFLLMSLCSFLNKTSDLGKRPLFVTLTSSVGDGILGNIPMIDSVLVSLSTNRPSVNE